MSLWSWLRMKFEDARKVGLDPESEWVVTVSETRVSCQRPNGLVESVEWDDLKVVLIETTDEGPFAIDVFWMLAGEKSGCVVPLGATGEAEMVARLQTLPNFNNEAFLEAMSSTENRRFICWQRADAG